MTLGRPNTTADVLRYWATKRPDHDAIRWDGGRHRLSYRELDERSNRVAQALRAEGVGAGDRVAFLDKNSLEQIELFFGAAKLNAVPAPVNYRLAPPEIARIVADSGARVFAVGEEFLGAVERIIGDLPGVRIIVIGGDSESGERGRRGAVAGGPPWASFSEWRDAHPAEDPMVPLTGEDVAYQLYSSGTTGRPKGAQLTQANLVAAVGQYPEIMGLGPDSTVLVAMPLYHIGGGGWALAGFVQGATNVLVREIVPERLVELIEAERITHTFFVPAVLQLMLGVPGVGDRDWSALEAILYGASPIAETVLATSMQTFRCQFVQAYGMTETSGTVVYLPAVDHDPDGPSDRLRAAGVPVPGTRIRVVDPQTLDDAPVRAVGEVYVQGPSVMKGYWKMPDQTAETITPDGWLRTGDAGYLDEDGYLYIHDRVKDMIISGAENIYPAEVENALMAHPAVRDVAVIGVPHDKWGETPLAFVVRASGEARQPEPTDEELFAFCRERLARYKCPTRIEWVTELPRNPSGKVLKKDLRAPYWEGKGRLVG